MSPRPTWPADGQNPYGDTLRNGLNQLSDRIDTLAAGATGAPPFIIVASADMPSDVKAVANYVCDGTGDQAEINQAIGDAAALASRNSGMPAGAKQRGTVLLTGGRFNLNAAAQNRTGVHLTGCGPLTEVRATGCNSAGLVTTASPADHLTMLSSMWLNGNWTAGGSCNGVDYDATGSGSTSGYPDTNPDSYHFINDLYVSSFTGGTRHGINLHATTVANSRGNMIRDIQIRNCSGDGIRLSSATDCLVSNCHIGTITGNGYTISGGNTMVTGCKAFYCDGTGFHVPSSRASLENCSAQDNATGFYLSSSDGMFSGLVADTSKNDGIVIATSGTVLSGAQVYLRSGGRYSAQTNGIRFTGSHTDCVLVGRVNPSNITNPLSGSPGARSFMRVTDGSTLHSEG